MASFRPQQRACLTAVVWLGAAVLAPVMTGCSSPRQPSVVLYCAQDEEFAESLLRPLLKGEQGGLFQTKHGKAAHQRIGQRDGVIPRAGVGKRVKALAEFAEQRINLEVLAFLVFGIG